jgi:hypothetical protein
MMTLNRLRASKRWFGHLVADGLFPGRRA